MICCCLFYAYEGLEGNGEKSKAKAVSPYRLHLPSESNSGRKVDHRSLHRF